ncbi:F-box domain, partial [Arabidopsis suecica]
MAIHGENRDGGSASVRVLNHRSEDLDTISSLPDVILQQILSLIQTKYAIRTSILSKRWRHVWSETPSLHFDDFYKVDADSIDKTLALYKARKIMTFQLCATSVVNLPYNEWIEFAMSRNVENLFLDFGYLKYNDLSICYSCYIKDKDVSNYLCGLNLNHCWIFGNVFHWNVESKHVASFMELMIKTTKALENMVVRLESYLDGRDFEELLEMVPMLSQNNNVSIEFSSISAW